MKAAFIDPQLRVLYYPTYDILTASGDEPIESDGDIEGENDE